LSYTTNHNGIGPLITEGPSHTTWHSDRVPRRFGWSKELHSRKEQSAREEVSGWKGVIYPLDLAHAPVLLSCVSAHHGRTMSDAKRL